MEETNLKAASKLINFRELNRVLGLSEKTIYSNRIPDKHKGSIYELFELIEKWIEKQKAG